jgi:hypothetical protein
LKTACSRSLRSRSRQPHLSSRFETMLTDRVLSDVSIELGITQRAPGTCAPAFLQRERRSERRTVPWRRKDGGLGAGAVRQQPLGDRHKCVRVCAPCIRARACACAAAAHTAASAWPANSAPLLHDYNADYWPSPFEPPKLANGQLASFGRDIRLLLDSYFTNRGQVRGQLQDRGSKTQLWALS